jgi:putative endonuclease
VKFPWTKSDREASAGDRAEAHAAKFLEKHGLKVRDRNFRCRFGELDIIAEEGDLLVFVEVRLRNHRQFASGMESVDYRKQQKLQLAAEAYLQKQFANNPPGCRFDVVSMASKPENRDTFAVEWLRDAFRPEV